MNKYFEGLLALCKNNHKTSKRIRELALEMMNFNINTARNEKRVILHKLNISWHNLQIIVYRMFQGRDHTKPMKAIEDFLDKRLKFINNGLNAKLHRKSGFLLGKKPHKGCNDFTTDLVFNRNDQLRVNFTSKANAVNT